MASASQLANPLGAQVIFDGENPRTFTATALETISGGFLVSISGATNTVGSQASSFSNGDFKVIGAQDITACNGIALNTAVSGGLVTVATRGTYLMYAGGIVSGGALVAHNASGCVQNWKGSVSGTSAVQETFIGRARTTSASGTSYFAAIDLLL